MWGISLGLWAPDGAVGVPDHWRGVGLDGVPSNPNDSMILIFEF